MEAAFAAITAIISIVVYSHSVFFFSSFLGGGYIVNIRKIYKHATACSITLDSCVESIQVLQE